MTAHRTDSDDLDSVVELASEFSPTPSPTLSISTENGDIYYDNQLQYYQEHGWPEGWGMGPLPQSADLTSEPACLVASGDPDGDDQPTVGDLSHDDARVSLTSCVLQSAYNGD